MKKLKKTKKHQPQVEGGVEVLALSDEALAGRIEPRDISHEMSDAYLDYAMSVIVSRALPDVRDGFKPVHRRILYSMWQVGLRANSRFKKCATVVGEVLGKYHPHGDLAVYDSLVHMAQDFKLRYPMVNGQGNFGSLDGDSAAAYRYTESKLRPLAEEMLIDIDKDTVDFRPTFDGTHKEPTVLPARVPNLLVNGTLGIAVGMATNIPPHNLTEVCAATIHLIENPEASIDDLLEFVKGPDFPTGGIIYDWNEIKQAYATGKGRILTRAKTEIAEDKKGNFRIIVHEIPFQVNKAILLERIADAVRDKKIEGIRDLWDESTSDGVRIIIELKKDAYPKKVLNRLYQLTQLQETFHVNMLALIDNGIQPRILNLKSVLEEFLKHRFTVVRRRTQFELKRAQDRAHILEGLRIALLQIDKVIETIKKSKDKDEARVNLMKKFKLSELQATAILEMRLQQLANLERLKIEQEWEEKQKLIAELESILKSEKKLRALVKTEVQEIKDKYGDARKTEVIKQGIKAFSMEDLIPDVPTVVMITRGGYIKRVPPDTFKTQTRGGKGVMGLTTKEEDEVEQMFSTTTHRDILFFTNRGRVFKIKAYDIPEAARTAKGQALVNFLNLAPGELVSSYLSFSESDAYKFLFFVTGKGTVKKTAIEEFETIRQNGLIAIKLNDGDNLEWVKPTSGKDDISLVTANGQSIRFEEDSVRSMGRSAAGVRGIRLKGADVVVGMDVINTEMANRKKQAQLLVIMENGLGKRTPIDEYKTQGRGGSGIRTAHVSAKTGKVISARIVDSEDPQDIMVISTGGQVIRMSIKSVSVLGRDTQGVRVMRFKDEKDKVASVTVV